MVEDRCGLENALEYVESHGSFCEKQIARTLNINRIRYSYEYPVAVVDRGKVRLWYPDFWLPDYGMAIEYLGVTNCEAYTERVQHKKDVYDAAGVSCVYVDAEDMKYNWPEQILNQVRAHLADTLERFDSLRAQISRK